MKRLFWLAALAACSPDVRVGGGYELVADVPTTPVTAVDVLFIVDDSGSMAQEQAALAARLEAFIEEIQSAPDLHIGVVSTNLGAGDSADPKCESGGDGGRLLGPPDGATCAGPDGPFIIHGDETNYPDGQLGETFGCIARRGTGGCGFEQPLEAMRRALDGSVPENDGFLRDEALLVIIFALDEDDCSAADETLFSAAQDDLDSELGQLSSFRCFDFGVTCSEGNARAVGPRSACAPRDDSPYMTTVPDYADFLSDLKGGPGLVLVSGLFGARGPVEVILDPERDDDLALADLCDGDLHVTPAVRMHGLLDALPRSTHTSLCDGATADHMDALAIDTALAVSAPECLMRTPLDTDDGEDGIQPTCRAFHLDGGARRELPPCGEVPCYEIVADGACTGTDAHLAVQVHGVEPAAGGRVQVECLALR